MIIWNDGSGNQTQDLKFQNQYLYTGENKGSIHATSKVTDICEEPTSVEYVTTSSLHIFNDAGSMVIVAPASLQGQPLTVYTTTGQLVSTITLHEGLNRIDGLNTGLYLTVVPGQPHDKIYLR